MTRQIAIVNLSNWDGEDYEVSQEYRLKPTRLKPGEHVLFVPNDKLIKVEPIEEEEPKPFRAPMLTYRSRTTCDAGEQRKSQVIPRMKIWFA